MQENAPIARDAATGKKPATSTTHTMVVSAAQWTLARPSATQIQTTRTRAALRIGTACSAQKVGPGSTAPTCPVPNVRRMTTSLCTRDAASNAQPSHADITRIHARRNDCTRTLVQTQSTFRPSITQQTLCTLHGTTTGGIANPSRDQISAPRIVTARATISMRIRSRLHRSRQLVSRIRKAFHKCALPPTLLIGHRTPRTRMQIVAIIRTKRRSAGVGTSAVYALVACASAALHTNLT